MKIAFVHEFLNTYAGSEKVLEQMLIEYPGADLFAVVGLPKEERTFLKNYDVKTSFIQKLPLAKTKYRNYISLMPFAVEQFDLSGYDIVVSNCHAAAKSVITGPDQLHISYVHSPMRYAWDLQAQYLREAGLEKGLKSWIARYMLHRLRINDLRSSVSVDAYMCNSDFIRRRIWKLYRRKAKVIYPPVETDYFSLCEKKENYYLTVSRIVPYKKIDMIVEAFARMPEKKLVVIGDGPEFEKARSKAGSNITLLGYQTNEVIREHMQKAKAFVFAAEEDFGIVPVEALSCGTPVIAYGKGGALETVKTGVNGLLYFEQTAESLVQAVKDFEESPKKISPAEIRATAENFNPARFRREFRENVETLYNKFLQNGRELEE